MANEKISFGNLEEYDGYLRNDANILKRNTNYIEGNIVNKGQVFLKCTQAGRTATTTLPLGGVSEGDVLVDGTVEWEVVSINGIPNGRGLEDWKANNDYSAESIFVYENQIYKALVGFTSGSTFENIEILEDYEPEEWQPNTSYVIGDIFIESGVLYKVVNAFTSGTTFSVTSDIELYNEKSYQERMHIVTDEIFTYSGSYYKALADFICGKKFTKTAFEEYVPKSLTDDEIDNIIEKYNPEFSGTTLFVVQDNAGAHNALYRENDITDYFNSGEMSEAIADGSFRGIFPGDYIIKSVTVNGVTYSDIKWIVGDLDYYLHNGDTECVTHHVLVFPEVCIGTSYMNSSNTSSGGYVGSYMWTTRMPQYTTGIRNAFGSGHVLSHRELLTTGMDTNGRSSAFCTWGGASNNFAWKDVLVNLFNENMVYGGAQCSSSMYDTGDGNHQIAAMRHNRQVMFTRSNCYWLRAVSTSTLFASCNNIGSATNSSASGVGGVRPYFLLY